MEEGSANPATSAAGPSAAQQQAQQQQQLLLQQQLFMMQQQQVQAQQRPRAPHMQQPQQQQANSLQQAMARFPSNIDAHLRAPGFRSMQTMQFAQAQLQQQQMAAARSAASAGAAGAPTSAPPPAAAAVRNPEIEMALQDASKVCNPDVKTPFSSIEDAVNRLLPYHVVSDYEAEEDDRAIESDKTGQAPSRLQQWDHNILVKIAEFTSTFEKQVLAFNIMTRKRALGEFRSEERLHLEQSLLHNEKRIALEARADIEARQKAAAQMAAASAAQADMMGATRPPAPMRGHAASMHGEDAQDQEAMRQGGWSGKASNSGGVNANNANDNENGDNNNNGEEEEEGDEDFLNNEENGDDEDDESGGELDLNAR